MLAFGRCSWQFFALRLKQRTLENAVLAQWIGNIELEITLDMKHKTKSIVLGNHNYSYESYGKPLYRILNHESLKAELLDLIESNVGFRRLKTDKHAIEPVQNAYDIIIWSKDYHCVFYVSDKEPQNCYVMGKKLDCNITGGEKIADYLDKYRKCLAHIILDVG